MKSSDLNIVNTRGTTPQPKIGSNLVIQKNVSVNSLDSNIDKLSEVDKIDYSYMDERFKRDKNDPE